MVSVKDFFEGSTVRAVPVKLPVGLHDGRVYVAILRRFPSRRAVHDELAGKKVVVQTLKEEAGSGEVAISYAVV